MKNVLQAAGFLLLFSTAAMAQSDVATVTKKDERKEKREIRRDNKEVSFQSKQHFMNDFPDAKNSNWNASVNFDEVTFTNSGVKTTAFYDFDSELVGTTVIKSFSDIPAKAQQNIKTHYKGYKPGEVIMFDDNEANETDMVLYGTSFEDEDNYFVSLKNNKETIVLKVNMEGTVSFFKKM
jgi:hypothetical protein